MVPANKKLSRTRLLALRTRGYFAGQMGAAEGIRLTVEGGLLLFSLVHSAIILWYEFLFAGWLLSVS